MATLSISAFTVLSGNVDLTALTVGGKSDDDWRVFASLTTTQQKSGGTGAISNFSYAGGSGTDAFNGGASFPRTLSWTDGTPTGSGSNNQGIRQNTFNTTDNRGFSFTVSGVGTGEQTCRVFVGRYSDNTNANNFRITASISDGSTGTQTSDLVGITSDQDGYYDITMAANSASQTVTITWQSNTTASNFLRAVNLRGAWLSTATASGVDGTIAVTLASDTSAISGTTTVTGSIASTLGNDTSAIAGTTTVTGSINVTLADDTSAISGAVGTAVDGTIAVTLADDTSAISGTTTVTGSINSTLANDTSAISGTTTVTGAIASTLNDDTLNASGTVGNVTGTINVTLGNDTLFAQGSTPSESLFGGVAHFARLDEDNRRRTQVRVQEIVEEVAKAVINEPEPKQLIALEVALEAQEIAFEEDYFEELKNQLIKEYMLAAEYRRIAIKNEEETIVFMMMALA